MHIKIGAPFEAFMKCGVTRQGASLQAVQPTDSPLAGLVGCSIRHRVVTPAAEFSTLLYVKSDGVFAASAHGEQIIPESVFKVIEFDANVAAALAALRGTGALLLNQAVLLRGVNDSAEALSDLCERGFAAGVLPYYLHQLDRVAGAAHFEVGDEQALALHAALAARLPGYLVPKLVREIAGDPGKRALAAAWTPPPPSCN